jgi:hypothetical protein
MRLRDGHDDRERGVGLPELVKRLEAVQSALEDYCATTRRLERSRRARASTFRAWLNADADVVAGVRDHAGATKVRS